MPAKPKTHYWRNRRRTIAQLAAEAGVSDQTMRRRLRQMPVAEAMTMPAVNNAPQPDPTPAEIAARAAECRTRAWQAKQRAGKKG